MKDRRVVITHWVHPEVIHYLESAGCEVIANDTKGTLPKAEILARAQEAVALMAFMPDQVDASFLDACPKLKIIAGALRGYDNFDVEACTKRNIWFTLVPALLAGPTAELTVGLLIAVSRRLLEGDDWVRSGQFDGWRPELYGTGLQNKQVGIVGMGQLGKALAQRLRGFDARIVYTDPQRLSDLEESSTGLQYEGFYDLLNTSHFVVLTTPLQPDTFHLINSSTIAAMQPGSYLVNPARGSVVDEQAVAAAIASGQLAGYAADVFEMEDWARSDRPHHIPQTLLEDRTRTVFTPHLGSAVADLRLEIALDAASSIVQALNGQAPERRVL
ncbi:MAG: phosphonate dehydrogenase [Cyanobacteria bacterium P01_D01_bin.115]